MSADKFDKLHRELVAVVEAIRAKLDSEHISSFCLEIDVSGRVAASDRSGVKITYSLKEQYESGTKGARLGPVADEFIRRYGWDKRNAPKELTYDDSNDTF